MPEDEPGQGRPAPSFNRNLAFTRLHGPPSLIIFPDMKHANSRPWTRIALVLVLILVAGLIIPQHLSMPVEGATRRSYDQHSFWAYPWGESVTHKGVDIFADRGTNVHSATAGLVVCTGQNRLGGNFVMVLGPEWRLHYYAHLNEIRTRVFTPVSHRSILGTVGNTGDAAGKPTHLHYTIKSIIPNPFRIDHSHQGWKKAFYINPIPYLNEDSDKRFSQTRSSYPLS